MTTCHPALLASRATVSHEVPTQRQAGGVMEAARKLRQRAELLQWWADFLDSQRP